jgi:hypothetical protein
MKLWDLRNTREPIVAWDGLPNASTHTDVCISPDEQFIVTGTSSGMRKGAGRGQLLFYQRDTLALAKAVEFDCSVLRIIWHDRIRQIVLGLADNTVRVLYDPKISERGALQCVSKPAPRHDPAAEVEFAPQVYIPVEEDLMKKQMSVEKQLRMIKRRERFQEQGRTRAPSKNPVMPPVVPGTGGRLGSSTTQFLLRDAGIVNPEAEEDPREALLRLDEKTKKNPYFTRQYLETQPVPIFQQPSEDQEPPRKKRT